MILLNSQNLNSTTKANSNIQYDSPGVQTTQQNNEDLIDEVRVILRESI